MTNQYRESIGRNQLDALQKLGIDTTGTKSVTYECTYRTHGKTFTGVSSPDYGQAYASVFENAGVRASQADLNGLEVKAMYGQKPVEKKVEAPKVEPKPEPAKSGPKPSGAASTPRGKSLESRFF